MKFDYTTLNIGGSMIHSPLGIPLKKSIFELGDLNDKRCDNLQKCVISFIC
jgi:hypothetical protein